ncbi:MAG: helix-turn-helix transcriptional regulator [Clostridiales bacterium]|jgi:YesN/AraC family two-component response regulator|nr:helix-turn-helix transcriptional regulator [Clostridiales bacterium]
MEARIRAAFAELAEKTPASGECLLEIYHLVVGALVSDSLSRGVGLSAWSDGIEGFLLSYGGINSARELQEKCLRATGQYFDALARAGTFRKSALVEEIMAYVRGNIACRLSVSGITERFFYNASYLTRIFKKETGYSIGDYIIKQRMERARELLAIPGKKAGDVCLEVGYESFPHFSRIFKKWYGASPKHFAQPG